MPGHVPMAKVIRYMAKGDVDDLVTTKEINNMFYNHHCSLIEAITTSPSQ